MNLKRTLRALCSIIPVAVVAPAPAQTGAPDPQALVQAWAAAFNECSAERLAALYDPGATLWGTNSTALIASAEGVRFYFDGACAMRPPVRVTLGDHTTRVFGDTATSAGTYAFNRDGRDLPARFSFAMVRSGGRWSIVQHHSSVLPTRP